MVNMFLHRLCEYSATAEQQKDGKVHYQSETGVRRLVHVFGKVLMYLRRKLKLLRIE